MDGRPIQDYAIKPGPARFSYALEFEKYEAARHAGLRPEDFDALPGSPVWMRPGQALSKCHVLMAYRMHKWIEAAGNEAQRRDFERKQALNKAKRGR